MAGKGLHGDRPGCLQKAATQAVIRGQVALSIIWRDYNGLVDMGYQKHLRVHQ